MAKQNAAIVTRWLGLISIVMGLAVMCQAQMAAKPELDLQKGHSGLITTFVFSPDGNLIASGGGDNTIKLWNVAAGKVIRTLEERSAPLALAFSPDGKVLATVNSDETIKLWAIEEGIVSRSLEGQSSPRAIAFSPDGKMLATGSGTPVGKSAGTIRFWDVQSGRLLQNIDAQTSVVTSIEFSSTGNLLASNSFDGTINLWNVQSGTLARSLKGGSLYSNQVFDFSPDGKLLAVAGSEIKAEKNISVWDVQKGQVVRSITGQKKPKSTSDPNYQKYLKFEFMSVGFSPDGQTIAAGSSDNVIRLWDAKTGKLTRAFDGSSGKAPLSLVFSPDGKLIAAIASIGSQSLGFVIPLWDANTGSLIRNLEEQSGSALSVAFSPDEKHLAAGTIRDTTNLWDVKSGKLVRRFDGHSTGTVFATAISPDGKVLASRSSGTQDSPEPDQSIKLWNMENGKLISRLSEFSYKHPAHGLAFSPDGNLVASVDGRKVKIWLLQSGRLIHDIDTNKEGDLYSVAFSPDGKTIAAAGEYKNIILCDVERGQFLRGFDAQDDNPIFRAIFSPDGRTIASGPMALFGLSKSQTVKLWDIQSGTLIKSFEGLTGSVGAITFSKDGELLAAGDLKGNLNIWDVSSGRLIHLLESHSGINSAVFTRDKKRLFQR